MGSVNYELLVSELIKPLATHPEAVVVTTSEVKGDAITLKVSVHPDDLGRIIGRKGRVANAIRTIAYTAAVRDKKHLDIDFLSEKE